MPSLYQDALSPDFRRWKGLMCSWTWGISDIGSYQHAFAFRNRSQWECDWYSVIQTWRVAKGSEDSSLTAICPLELAPSSDLPSLNCDSLAPDPEQIQTLEPGTESPWNALSPNWLCFLLTYSCLSPLQRDLSCSVVIHPELPHWLLFLPKLLYS
jgi:hypothetical protein